VADGVFLFGFRRGTALAAVTLPLAFVSGYVYLQHDARFAGAAFLASIMVPVAAFVVGICKAVLDAEESRREARALLRELEGANAELKRQAAKAKELAISEERARIAREVHDSVGHHLTAINLQLQNAERFGDRDPDRSRQKVREARESTLSALAEVKRSVRALKPPALEERSGVAALAALARSFDGAGPDVSFELVGEERVLSEQAELALYRATQEALTNAAKHSDSRRVRVSVAFERGETRLVVADDGEGAPEGIPGGGFGLAALHERIEALGGTLAAGNRPEGGFALEIVLPIEVRTGPEAG
jgi:signal transduction histidine kinase